MTQPLSRIRFAAGLRCPKLLWWQAREPDAPEWVPDAGALFLRDEAASVREAARGSYPGGFLVDLPAEAVPDRVEATRRALERGDPAVFQGTFLEGGVLLTVDILSREGSGYALVQVEPTTSLKPHHLWDAAVQAYVLRLAGVDVDAVEIMFLNGDCRFPDLHRLFTRESVSGRVRALVPKVPELLAEQIRLLEGPLPEQAVGAHCDHPEPCPFKTRCWPAHPSHHVETFHGLRRERSALLDAQGYTLVEEVPASFPLTAIQKRQRRSVTSGELQVEGDLAASLRPFGGRAAYLAFETVNPVVPFWEGLGPWHPHPVQFSCHTTCDGRLEHREWMAEGAEDSRSEMARALVEAVAGADVVVAYDMGRSKRCLDTLVAGAPDYGPRLHAIGARMRDLLPVVRDHVYHPDFMGSFSLAVVLPALLPGIGHEATNGPEGGVASALLHRLLVRGDPAGAAERRAARRSLMDRRALETGTLVRLKERLEELAGSSG